MSTPSTPSQSDTLPQDPMPQQASVEPQVRQKPTTSLPPTPETMDILAHADVRTNNQAAPQSNEE